jgi:hypothetical protein
MTPSTIEAGARIRQARRWFSGSWLLMAILAMIVLVASGCSAPDCSGIPQDGAVRVSQQAAQRLQVRIDAVNASQTPDFTLEGTDEEVTSYLASFLQQSPLADAQVRFAAGRVRIWATATQLLNLSVATVWTAQVDAGLLRIALESATVSCVPVPPQLLESVSATLNQMIVESQVDVQVKEIRIDPGKITVAASKTK